MKKLTMMAMAVALSYASLASNYTASWGQNGTAISIEGEDYRDLLDSAYWGGMLPTSMGSGDNLLMGSSANITVSGNATLLPYFVFGTANAIHNMNLNGKTLTATQNGLRNMISGAKFTLSNGTLKLGTLLWPDRSASSAVRSGNVFTVTGTGTTLDVGNLYFGYNMGSQPGQGCGNKIIVADGAFAAANVNLAYFQSFSGEPNGLYVTGSGTVFSNKNANSRLAIQNNVSADSFSNEFVVADGAVVKGVDNFQIGATRATSYGEGHLLAFCGPNTTHTFKGGDSTLGLSHRLEVDGAAITTDNVYIHNFGFVEVTNGGSITGKIGQYGTLLLSGEGSRIEANVFNMNQSNVPSVRTEVVDGAFLSVTAGDMNFGANGNTNASLFARNGGKVSCGTVNVGYASTNLTFSTAPYGCVLEVDGVGSIVSNVSMSVGTAINSGTGFKGCGTNGHDNVVRVMNGGRIRTDPNSSISIGSVCPSNSLEVLGGGLLECGALYIGRMGTGDVGSFKAKDIAFDNRCVVAGGGTIESTGRLSIRGNNSLCYVTNGVMHTTDRFVYECERYTGLLQIAGTNSLLKGDLAFQVSSHDGHIDFMLPREGYARAPIQSDNLVSFPNTTVVGFIPPVDTGNIANIYTLAQVPDSGTLEIPDSLIAKMRATLVSVAAQDERFANHKVKIVIEDGYKRLQLRAPGGVTISFR